MNIKFKIVSQGAMKCILCGLVIIPLFMGQMRIAAQTDNAPSVIDVTNVRHLQSVQQLDFSSLPDNIQPASGQFVTTPNAQYVVTFGNLPGDPPFSQAILWGYGDNVIANRIDDSSITRIISDDGRCLFAGYRGYYTVWELDATSDMASLWHGPVMLPNEADTVANLWLADSATCTTDVYVEAVVDDGRLAVYEDGTNGLQLLHTDILSDPSGDVAARVGRIPPPLALTVNFDGLLSRWDMTTNTPTAQVEVGELAMFGTVNASGTHYIWQAGDGSGLSLVDLESKQHQQVVAYDGLYIPHLGLSLDADVVLAIDPSDARGIVAAWLLDSGERINLGKYRSCDRVQPDLVKLTSNGTTLVIGCDSGIDIWQVLTDNGSNK